MAAGGPACTPACPTLLPSPTGSWQAVQWQWQRWAGEPKLTDFDKAGRQAKRQSCCCVVNPPVSGLPDGRSSGVCASLKAPICGRLAAPRCSAGAAPRHPTHARTQLSGVNNKCSPNTEGEFVRVHARPRGGARARRAQCRAQWRPGRRTPLPSSALTCRCACCGTGVPPRCPRATPLPACRAAERLLQTPVPPVRGWGPRVPAKGQGGRGRGPRAQPAHLLGHPGARPQRCAAAAALPCPSEWQAQACTTLGPLSLAAGIDIERTRQHLMTTNAGAGATLPGSTGAACATQLLS